MYTSIPVARTQRVFNVCTALALWVAACGDDDVATTPTPDASDAADGSAGCAADVCEDVSDVAAPCTRNLDCPPATLCASDGSCEPAAAPPLPEAGARPVMNFEAAISGAAFFDAPYPSDLRRDADGTVRLAGLPNTDPATAVDIFLGLVETAEQLPGFSQIPVVWFRLDAAPQAFAWEDTLLAQPPGLPAHIVNIDPVSVGYGETVPVALQTIPADDYIPANVLGVSPRAGVVLRPNTRYAVMLDNLLQTADGVPVGPDPITWALVHGAVPQDPRGDELAELYRPLLDVLPQVGLEPGEIVASTVFTTGDAPADLSAMGDRVRDAHDATFSNLRVDPDNGATHPLFCEILADATLPQFQVGTPPFDADGLFVLDEQGTPVRQRDETFPVVITLPLQPMPAAGYPLVMYFHGSGGTHDQVVSRSLEPAEGVGPVDQGPAHILAFRELAAFGSAHPVSPDRVPGASSIAYLNFNNLKMFRDLFRQGVFEQRLLLDALLALEITPDVVADCQGLSLADGQTSYRFNAAEVLAMGQSMGGQYTNLVGATEPRIRAVVPTGAGGYWSFFIFQATLLDNIPSLLQLLLGSDQTLSYMHPVFSVLQQAWEPVEPMVYMPRLALWPIDGHPVRPVYEPVAPGDSFFATIIYDAMALAYGHPQAGDEVWPTTQQALALVDRDGLQALPVTDNAVSLDGTAYTGAVVQHEPDGFSDPHNIFVQLEAVRHQYGCFFRTFLDDGRATIVVGGDSFDAPCE